MYLTCTGLVPAATILSPSAMKAADRMVAVVVPSPAVSLVRAAAWRTSVAPMFSTGSSSSTSLAMVTPSLTILGEPYLLSSTTLRPLGPSVTPTTVASLSAPACIFLSASMFLLKWSSLAARAETVRLLSFVVVGFWWWVFGGVWSGLSFGRQSGTGNDGGAEGGREGRRLFCSMRTSLLKFLRVDEVWGVEGRRSADHRSHSVSS